ncbi:hypothetical protein GA0115257_117520 [Streptomyces sp. LcepLS]|nr:hypothetical protein GA0115257_117520 [Streptomyces sp. LcepLS]
MPRHSPSPRSGDGITAQSTGNADSDGGLRVAEYACAALNRPLPTPHIRTGASGGSQRHSALRPGSGVSTTGDGCAPPPPKPRRCPGQKGALGGGQALSVGRRRLPARREEPGEERGGEGRARGAPVHGAYGRRRGWGGTHERIAVEWAIRGAVAAWGTRPREARTRGGVLAGVRVAVAVRVATRACRCPYGRARSPRPCRHIPVVARRAAARLPQPSAGRCPQVRALGVPPPVPRTGRTWVWGRCGEWRHLPAVRLGERAWRRAADGNVTTGPSPRCPCRRGCRGPAGGRSGGTGWRGPRCAAAARCRGRGPR